MPPQQFTNPSQTGVALYYLPAPGRPYNPMADFVATYTAKTNEYARQTFAAWLASQGRGDPRLELEKQITARMTERERTFRQAQSLSVQQQLDYNSTFRTLVRAHTDMATTTQTNQANLAREREATRRAVFVEGMSLDDPTARELVRDGESIVAGARLQMEEAMRNQDAAAFERAQRDLAINLNRNRARAGEELEELQLGAYSRHMTDYAATITGGMNPGDPDLQAVLQGTVSDALGVQGTSAPARRPGFGGINEGSVIGRSIAEADRLHGIGAGDDRFPPGGRVAVSSSGPGRGFSTIGPQELDLSDLGDDLVASQRAQQHQLEELLVRQLAPGIMRRRDRDIERRLAEAGIEMDAQSALALGRQLNRRVPIGSSSDPEDPSVPLSEQGQNQGEHTTETGGGPLPSGTLHLDGRPDPNAPAPAETSAGARGPRDPRGAAPAGRSSGGGVQIPGAMSLSYEDALRLDRSVPSEDQLLSWLEEMNRDPTAVPTEVADRLLTWWDQRLAIQDALMKGPPLGEQSQQLMERDFHDFDAGPRGRRPVSSSDALERGRPVSTREAVDPTWPTGFARHNEVEGDFDAGAERNVPTGDRPVFGTSLEQPPPPAPPARPAPPPPPPAPAIPRMTLPSFSNPDRTEDEAVRQDQVQELWRQMQGSTSPTEQQRLQTGTAIANEMAEQLRQIQLEEAERRRARGGRR